MNSSKIRRGITAIAGALVLAYVALLLANKGHELPMQSQESNPEHIRTIAVFGATGTIGDGLLKAAIDDSNVQKIHVVTRRPSPRIEEGVASGKVEMTIHKDFLEYASLHDVLAEAEAGFGHHVMHTVLGPLRAIVEAEAIGRAMLEVSARDSSYPNGLALENKDIILLGSSYDVNTKE